MNSVVPCVSQFAVVSKDDANWKSLNYQVILKTRHKSPKVPFVRTSHHKTQYKLARER